MDPTVRYDLHPGEWRPDPPHVSYGCDRNGIVALLTEEQRAAPWTRGESEEGPAIEVRARRLACPPSAEDVEWLVSIATPAPYGRGEDTLLDAEVRDALQVPAEHVKLGGASWERLRGEMLRAIATDMGLDDATIRLEPLKLLVYRTGGHFTDHSDTEKTPGMIASAALIVPGAWEGGALGLEHAGERLRVGDGGDAAWRWAAWYADCRHRLEPVESGVRIAMTFAVAIDPERPLARRKATNHRLGWALGGRTYAEWHTEWAAREHRTKAGNEQYGQKTVWVLTHRYTEPGLRGNLLKGRDRDLARVLLDEPRGEVVYLGWLQIREVGPADDDEGTSWGDHTVEWYEPEDEDEHDDDPPPESMASREWLSWTASDPAPMRIAHRATPELHLSEVARHNAWIERLRSLDGKVSEHGPIEVLDGETVPAGALDEALPDGARLYEATGNEGASLELQYRRAVLVLWRRNKATLRMLARCGGRLALAVEYAQREADQRRRYSHEGGMDDVLALWAEALATDGGGPEPRAHRLVLDALAQEAHRDEDAGRLRARYIEAVAAIDLDAHAAAQIAQWLGERLESGEPIETWIGLLRDAVGGAWGFHPMPGAPALLRALCARPETEQVAKALLSERAEPAESVEAVLEVARSLEERLAEAAWTRRRSAKMTADTSKGGGCRIPLPP